MGSAYSIRSYWQPADLPRDQVVTDVEPTGGQWERLFAKGQGLWDSQVQPILRWILYGEVSAVPRTQRVLLWVGEPSNP